MTTEAVTLDRVINGCDSHVHIMGDPGHYLMVPERRYTPGLASTDQLQKHLETQGLERAVIVQPSVYGFDNRCTLDAVQVLQGKARAVLVLPEGTTAAQLQAFDAQGARGIRLNIESTGHFNGADLADQLQHWGTRLADVGWHIQVYAPMAWIAACSAVIEQLPVPVVLDHFALWTDATCTNAESMALLRLLEAGRIYIKLSGSYRVPIKEPEALYQVTHKLLSLRPDRLLWGSDWPHTNREEGRSALQVSRYRAVDPAAMRQERMRWVAGLVLADHDWTKQVLIDNPARLYRF